LIVDLDIIALEAKHILHSFKYQTLAIQGIWWWLS